MLLSHMGASLSSSYFVSDASNSWESGKRWSKSWGPCPHLGTAEAALNSRPQPGLAPQSKWPLEEQTNREDFLTFQLHLSNKNKFQKKFAKIWPEKALRNAKASLSQLILPLLKILMYKGPSKNRAFESWHPYQKLIPQICLPDLKEDLSYTGKLKTTHE